MPAIGFLVTPHSLHLTPYGILRGRSERRVEYLRYALCAMRFAVWKWRRIGWKNVCKLWLEEHTAEQLKGESG
jgi:hypothetical protein